MYRLELDHDLFFVPPMRGGADRGGITITRTLTLPFLPTSGLSICGREKENPGQSGRPARMAAPMGDVPIATWQEMLGDKPPGGLFRIAKAAYVEPSLDAQGKGPASAAHEKLSASLRIFVVDLPIVRMRCWSADCEAPQNFAPASPYFRMMVTGDGTFERLVYRCRNCKESIVWFALQARLAECEPHESEADVVAVKVGQWPMFRIDVAKEATEVLGDAEELFAKGLSSEEKDLGIGAAAYYRRIVERRKGDLLDLIAGAARSVGAGEEFIRRVDAAKGERQFKAALADIKDLVPKVFFIDGKNPLAVLHAILSEDLHEKADHECLANAHDTRNLLLAMLRKFQALTERDALAVEVMRKRNKEESDRGKGSA